jgi:hypothetical protein
MSNQTFDESVARKITENYEREAKAVESMTDSERWTRMNQLIESEAPTNLTKISEQAREVRWQLLEAVSQDADALAHCSAASLREISRHLGGKLARSDNTSPFWAGF